MQMTSEDAECGCWLMDVKSDSKVMSLIKAMWTMLPPHSDEHPLPGAKFILETWWQPASKSRTGLTTTYFGGEAMPPYAPPISGHRVTTCMPSLSDFTPSHHMGSHEAEGEVWFNSDPVGTERKILGIHLRCGGQAQWRASHREGISVLPPHPDSQSLQAFPEQRPEVQSFLCWTFY